MAKGQYRIVEMQFPIEVPGIGARIAGHNFLVLLGPDGEKVAELHGLATDADGICKPIGDSLDDRLKSAEYPGTKCTLYPFYQPSYAQEGLAAGDQTTILNLWNAARAAAARMDEQDIRYPVFGIGKNSNSFASTLIAAMGLTEPHMRGGAGFMPGARSMLLEPKAIQDIQRRFNITPPRLDDAPREDFQPGESSRPSPLDPASVPYGPVGAPNDRATAPQVPDPSSAVSPRPDLRGTAVLGAQGRTSLGGPNGPRPLLPPANSRSPAPYTPTAPAADPLLPPLHFAPETPQRFGPFEVPGLFRSDVFGGPRVAPAADGMGTNPLIPPTPAFGAPGTSAPATSPAASGTAGQIGDGNGIGDWWKGVAPAAAANSDPSSFGGFTSPMLGMMPVDPSQPLQAAAAPLGFAGGVPRISAPTVSGMAALPRVDSAFTDWWNGLVADVDAASRRAGLGGLSPPVPNNVPAPPTQPVFDRGLPGMLQRAGAFDPSAGGLLGRLLELQRNHPDDDRR